MSYLIALNISQYTDERIFRAIFDHYEYNLFTIKFYTNCGHKSALISFRNTYIVQIVIEDINKKTINGVFLDLILADEETKLFLMNNKKTIYFQITAYIRNNTYESIKSEFEKYGKVEEFNYNKKALNGCVTFEITESALKAKDDLNQKLINGNKITIGFSTFDKSLSFFFQQIQMQNEKMPIKNENESSIFVFDIPEEIDEKTLRKIFEKFKVIEGENGVTIKTKYNYDSKITKYAIITFYNRLNAEYAIKALNYTECNGTTIRLVFADSDTRKILATNKGKLLISNLDKDIKVSELHDSFENFGKIIECEIPSDNGASRGYGYVHFFNEKDAIQARLD